MKYWIEKTRYLTLVAVGLGIAVGTARAVTAPAFDTGNVVIQRVGNGEALDNLAHAVFLDEYTPAGLLKQTIALPTASSGASRALVGSGTVVTEGFLTRSANGNCLVIPGYQRDVGVTGNLTGSNSANVPRTIGRVTATGAVDTTTALIPSGTAIGSQFRGVASDDCSNLWAVGNWPGVRYLTVGAPVSPAITSGTDIANGTPSLDTHTVGIAGGQLYITAGGGGTGPIGISAVGAGLPTAGSQTPARLPGFTNTTSVSPYSFFFADLSTGVAGVPGVDTLYIADETNGAGGAITKYSLVSGSWVSNGTVGATSSAYRGLAGTVSSNGTVTLYAIRSVSTTGGQLVKIVDSTGYNSAAGLFAGLTVAQIAVAANATSWRGIAMAPDLTVTPSAGAHGTISPNVPQAVSATSQPVFSASPDPGYSVQWSGTCNGTPNGTQFTSNAITVDCSVIATFIQNPFIVTPSVSGGNGTVSPNSSVPVQSGQTAQFTMSASGGYQAGVPGGTCPAGSFSGNLYTTGAITADCSVTFAFNAVQYKVSSSAGLHGTISPSGDTFVSYQAQPQFTVTPASGYYATVTGSCNGSLANATYTTNAVTSDCTVLANFAALPVVTSSAIGHGQISPSGSQAVSPNSTLQFTIMPDAGYTAVVSGCGGKMNAGTLTFTTGAITANCTVTASFSQKNILFVGNSYTFARVDPALTFNAANVNDLTADFNAQYPNGTNSWPWSGSTCTGASVSDGCFEPHPWGGVPGIFKALTVQAGLDYNVSLSTRNAATLRGHFLNTSNNVWDLRSNIASQKWDIVMVQGQSDEPLPANKSKNGNPESFKTYANQIAKYVHQGNGQSTDLVTDEQTIYATEGFGTSNSTTPRTIPPNFNANPSAKVYVMQNWSRPDMVEAHKCTVPDYKSHDGAPLPDPTCAGNANGTGGNNNVYYTTQPTTALNLNDITTDMNSALSSLVTANSQFSGVIPSGNAFQKAVDAGVVKTSGFYDANGTYDESGPINMWWLDRTHPSKYGAYTSALVHFARLTGQDPTQFGSSDAVAAGLGIASADALTLQQMAKAAVVPGAPTAAAAAAGNGQVTVTFTAPVNLGGLDITGYTATCGTQSASGTGSPIIVSVTNGTTGTCTVTASNSVGSGVASLASNSVTPSTVPGAPVITGVTAGDQSVSVVFTAPADGGMPLTGYSATCGLQTQAGSSSPISVGGLTNGTAVTCTVVASNSNGPGNASAASASVTPQAQQTISFPAVGTKTYAPSGTFTVAATATSGNAVSFSSLTSGVCTVASTTVTIVTAGNCRIRASQAGSAAFAAAPDVDQDITINQATQAITFNAQTPPGRVYSRNATFSVSPAASGGASGNPIVYSSLTTSVCTTGGTNGSTVTLVSVGTCTIAADQAGSTSYSAATQVSQSVTVIPPAISMSPATLPPATVDAAFSQAFSGVFGTGPYTFTLGTGALPAGLTLSAAGLLSGTPTTAGAFSFSVSVKDSSTASEGGPFTGSFNYSGTVAKGPQTITFGAQTPSTRAYVRNATFSFNPVATGGASSSPVIYSSTTPAICTTGGTNGGTVTMLSVGACSIGANQNGDVNYLAATQVVQSIALTAPTIAVSPPTLPKGTYNSSYSQTVTAANGTGPYMFATGGTPPPGLVLNGSGTLSGTPTAAGTFNFSVNATDSSTASEGGPFTGSQAYALTIDPAVQTITFVAQSPASRPFINGGTFAVNPAATGGTSGNPVTYSSLTPSVCSTAGTNGATVTTLSTGTCTIAANQAANANFSAATQVTQNVSIVAPTVTVSPATLPAGTTTAAYSQTLSAAGGTSPYSFSISAGSLPPGLALSSSGVLAGNPTTAGVFNFTVGAVDSASAAQGGPFSGATSYAVTIDKGAATIVVTSSVNPSAVGQTVTLTTTVTGSGATPTGSVTFLDNGTAICQNVALAAGQAQCVTMSLTAGSHPISAGYGGNGTYSAGVSSVLTQAVNPSGNQLMITRGGSGGGSVSSPGAIACGTDCTESYVDVTQVTLTALADGNSIFSGWLGGGCTGTAPTCTVTVQGTVPVSATFVPMSYFPFRIDIDGNHSTDASSDGLLIMRYLFGLTGAALADGALGAGSTATNAQIETYLNNVRPLLDIDGNGEVDALTDAILVRRYLSGLRGNDLIVGAVGSGATRTLSGDIEAYIKALLP